MVNGHIVEKHFLAQYSSLLKNSKIRLNYVSSAKTEARHLGSLKSTIDNTSPPPRVSNHKVNKLL